MEVNNTVGEPLSRYTLHLLLEEGARFVTKGKD